MTRESATRPERKSSRISVIVVIVLLLILVGGGWCCWKYYSNQTMTGYQAVFLSNGQVYFGKVSNLHSDYAQLTNIYYLQLGNSLQAQNSGTSAENDASSSTTVAVPSATDQSKLTLMKLGNELHGPEDSMLINTKQILFVENLKDDSKVVTAIKQYQTQGTQK